MIGTDENGFKQKPTVEGSQTQDDPLLLCYCDLACEYFVRKKSDMCEVCDCTHPFTPQNAQQALTWLHEERVKVTHQLNEQRNIITKLRRAFNDLFKVLSDNKGAFNE